jgi:hypothetical protein
MPVQAIHDAGAFCIGILDLERCERELVMKLFKSLANGNPLEGRQYSRNGRLPAK